MSESAIVKVAALLGMLLLFTGVFALPVVLGEIGKRAGIVDTDTDKKRKT